MNYKLEPYTILVDTREQHGYSFTGFTADARYKRADGTKIPLIVPVEQATLRSGDYSLKGYEHQIAIERKSKQDAYASFSQQRDRFERELLRLADLPGWAGVVIEASLASCMFDPPPHSQYTGKSFYRQYIAWMVRYRNIQWMFCETRCEAERIVLRTLQRYWRDDQKRQKELQYASSLEASQGSASDP